MPLVPSSISVVGQAENFSPCPYAAANAHGAMGCDQKSSIILVWRLHQLLSGSLPNGRLLEFHIGSRLGRELFTLPYAATDAHGAMRCDQKSFILVWR